MFLRATISVFALSLAALACSSTSTGTGTSSGSAGSSGSTPISTADCKSRCSSKATTCGATSTQAAETCGSLCDGTLTDSQLTCLEGKSCNELASANLASLCPGSTSTSGGTSGSGTSGGGGGSKQLGDSCTCANVSSSSQGLCSGTSEECASGLSCVYDTGSSGAGQCMGSKCCDTTSACDANPSLLKSCTAGSCKKASLGYFCQK
jgi:hypothetical protein